MAPEPALLAANPIEVLYVDDFLIVLNKPPGLLSVPGRGADKQDCLSLRVQAHYPDALVVHRLDMSTSGLIVMARGPAMHSFALTGLMRCGECGAAMQRALNTAFSERAVRKRYEAIASGAIPPTPDTWETIALPIAVDWPNRPLRVVDATGQPSTTRYQVLQIAPDQQSTLVAREPYTGRTHQLRVHLKAIGHPIVGDALYAPEAVCMRAPRLLLHACALAFTHPATGESLQFTTAPTF